MAKTKIITVVNQKGGTGKTTTVMNLGIALSKLNKKLLLIDLDPQANLTYSFGIKEPSNTIGDILQTKQVLQTLQAKLINNENVSLIPSNITLADVELSLVGKMGRENILKDKLKNFNDFDYIFIDSPPSLSILTINALNAANEVLIPVQMEVLSLQGLSQLLNTINEVRQILNKNIKIGGIIPFMYDGRRKLSKEILKELKETTKENVFNTAIRECVKIAEAPSFAKSVLSYAPSSNGAQDFMQLAEEFISTRS